MKRNGQAMIVLLFYLIIAITLTTAAIALVMSNSLAVSDTEQGNHALEAAEGGMENALIRLLRSTDYTGESLTVGSGTAIVTVSGETQKTIVSQGSVGGFDRSVRVTVEFTNGVMTILSWQEI